MCLTPNGRLEKRTPPPSAVAAANDPKRTSLPQSLTLTITRSGDDCVTKAVAPIKSRHGGASGHYILSYIDTLTICNLLACIVVATSLSVVESAQSATMVVTGGTPPATIYATAVDDITIDTVIYNVTFSTTADTTFLGNSSGAIDASRALRDALNTSTATAINAALAVGFIVEEQTTGGEPVDYNSTAGDWQAPGGPATVTGGLIADFNAVTANATPLPGALPLFATVLGGMGLFGWRKKRKDVAAMAAA
jgi:hypothetical protein